jgi:BASS family bile acid:Na+ symporter
MARGDLALASALTGLFPFLSAFITPLICEYSLKPWLQTSVLRFNIVSIFLVLFSTITLPLAVGMAVSHRAPAIAAWLLKPVEVVAEATGSIALLFVTVVEFKTILSIGWRPLSAMVLTSELCFLIGYALSGPARAQRLVVGLGTANRNIALALLIAVASFPGSPIVAAVVANGLLLIFLGLVHVFLWRLLLPVKNDG